jgi:hypothetical protein
VKRAYLWFLLLPAVLLLAPVVTANLPREDRQLLTQVANWKPSRTGVHLVIPRGWDIHTERVDSIYCRLGLFPQEKGDGSGNIESNPFPAPGWISLTVTGDLTRPGNEVYFLSKSDRSRVPVRVHTEENYWRRVTCRLPSEWAGKPIQLVAEAAPRTEKENWFGISNPRAFSTGTVADAQIKTVALLPTLVGTMLLFLLPGLPPAVRLVRYGVVGPVLFLPLAIVVSSLSGYAAFWVYLFKPEIGPLVAEAILAGSAGWCLFDMRKGSATRALFLSEQLLTPLALMVLVGLLVLSLLYSVDLETGPDGQPRYRFIETVLALDNEIPYFFADALYPHKDRDIPKEFSKSVPGWHSSDRPPLQTGLILLQMSLARQLADRIYGEKPANRNAADLFVRLGSLAAAISLQCAWVPAVWALWTLAGLTRRQAGLALLFVVLTGFAVLNTAFSWPKMLSAALALFTVIIGLFERGRGRQGFSFGKAILLGLSAALATLGHGGVAFTLLPFGLLLLMPRWYPGISRLAVAAAVYLAMLYPWSHYQKTYDPPGTKLLKLHLAGNTTETETEEWRDDRPTWQNIRAAYEAKSIGEILEYKFANLKVLFTAAPDQYPWPPNEAPARWPTDASSFRRCDFLSLFWALGLLNLGWVVAGWRALRVPLPFAPVLGFVVPLLGLASIITWVVLMFGPGATVVHQGSYATFLLLFAALAAWLATLPERIAYLLLGVQGLLFTTVWLLTSPANGYGLPNVFMIPLALFFFGVLVPFALGTDPSRKQGAAKAELAA